MCRTSNSREWLTGLFVVLGFAMVFGPVVLLLERWREAFARDPENSCGALWLSEQVLAYPYLMFGALPTLSLPGGRSLFAGIYFIGFIPGVAGLFKGPERPGGELSTGSPSGAVREPVR